VRDTATAERSAEATDRFDAARAVADAVLYEGYVLYPYRASSRKNQVRFQWGVLTPKEFSESEGSERWSTSTECLIAPPAGPGVPTLHVRVRCLQTQHRSLEAWVPAAGAGRPEPGFAPVDSLTVDGTLHVEWDEAIDQIIDVPPLVLDQPGALDETHRFTLQDGAEHEPVVAADGTLAGRFVRVRRPVRGVIRVTTADVPEAAGHLRVRVTVENTTEWSEADGTGRAEAMAGSLVAVHTMLALDGARFVSLLDPPEDASAAAAACRSDGAYPVLIGDEDVVLASPIILYDHPEVAPQSPGDLYDSLEIDEILALRVMTLTDAEKAEARGTDPRAAAIIDRCDALSPDAMSRLHGQMRPVDPAVQDPFPTFTTPGAPGPQPAEVPWWDPAADESVDPWSDRVTVGGVDLAQGSLVRLHPSGGADAQDMFLEGRVATVAGVFSDVDGGFHLAVTLDDDPAAAELVWQGRYYYFRPDEIEPLGEPGQ
jgi:hypothetical protein